MMIKKIAAAAALVVAAVPAVAAINGGFTAGTPGELFLAVYDATAKVSYTLDLAGFDSHASFKAVADANAAGFSNNWSLAGDANWATFTQAADLSKARWMVVSVERANSGATLTNGQRLFTTVKAGDEAKVGTARNQTFTTAVGQMVSFFSSVNTTGTHGAVGTPVNYSVDGSSFNRDSDSGAGYVGEGITGGLSGNFNQNFPFNAASAIGTSAEFVFLTRSSNNANGFLLVDKFENTAGAGLFSFTNAAGGPVLNYTLAAAIPEPSTYAMLLAGLMGVGFMARRRQG